MFYKDFCKNGVPLTLGNQWIWAKRGTPDLICLTLWQGFDCITKNINNNNNKSYKTNSKNNIHFFPATNIPAPKILQYGPIGPVGPVGPMGSMGPMGPTALQGPYKGL